MEFYHSLIAQKSWLLLQALKKKYEFILIGGWAVYLYSRALKSKDIDLILDYSGLEKMKEELTVTKNERLQKYEARSEETEIDLYLPYYSNLGLPVEEVVNFKNSLEGFVVPQLEILALLKAKALSERKGSVKGRKDLVDLVSLFALKDLDFAKTKALAKKYGVLDVLHTAAREIKAVSNIEELNLNLHQMAGFKKKILPLLS